MAAFMQGIILGNFVQGVEVDGRNFASTNLKLHPLEREQHGFTKAKSCDSAISVALSYIEYPLMRGEYAIMALLDFESAYDSLQNSSMIDALWRHHTDERIIS